MKKIKWKNLIKLVVMGACIVLLLHDFVAIVLSIFNDNSLGLTFYGMLVDGTAVFTAQMLWNDLMEEE